jgi:beta-N-acetylhexosaminidase
MRADGRSSISPAAPTPQRAPSNLSAEEWVEQTLRSLSLREKVGQMLVPRISGAYLPVGNAEYQRLYDWVVKQGIGGVVITQGPPLEMASS